MFSPMRDQNGTNTKRVINIDGQILLYDYLAGSALVENIITNVCHKVVEVHVEHVFTRGVLKSECVQCELHRKICFAHIVFVVLYEVE